jgi:hypothetical protein
MRFRLIYLYLGLKSIADWGFLIAEIRKYTFIFNKLEFNKADHNSEIQHPISTMIDFNNTVYINNKSKIQGVRELSK